MSIGEILVKALTNTALGMGTVFIVLIFIAYIISLLPKVTGMIESVGRKKPPVVEKKAAPPVPVKIEEEPEEELIDDLELVAVITAAIAATEGMSTDGFVVRSIRKSTQNRWRRV